MHIGIRVFRIFVIKGITYGCAQGNKLSRNMILLH